ncbi:MAG TPA: MBG domain-containing protein [Acidisarcina sp.]
MGKSLLVWLFCLSGAIATAQTAPKITIGITAPVIGSPATILVLVTDPALVLVPTGQVTLDFGDNSPAASLTLSTTRVAATHTYTTPGQLIINASYAGDANFSSAAASVTVASLVSAPGYNLYTFGDSITGALPGTWPVTLSAALGWPRINFANGGFKTNDEAPAIYQSVVDTSYATTWMLGQNDGLSVYYGGQVQFQQAVLAENAWLAIPEGPAKLRAQSTAVTQTGPWAVSDIFTTTGIRTSTAGASLSATVPGNVVYLGLSSLLTTDYTVDVVIDGVVEGPLSPVSTYVGKVVNGEPYGSRYPLSGSQTATHTVQVVCVNPGISGCYVDWIGGNGLAKPNAPPYLFTGVSYTTLQGDPPASYALRQGIVRTIESQLESDSLAIRLADIAANFSGPELPQCLTDPIHPGQCGADALETVWLSSMSYLATEAQRIDVPPAVASVGAPVTLTATATSGLPVLFKVVSGPGTLSGNQLTASQTGTIVVEADQPGTSTVLPAAPVQTSIPVMAASLTVTALNESSIAGAPTPTFGFTITGFVNGDTQSSSVSGAPVLSTTATATSPAGRYPITVAIGTLASPKYSFNNFVAGTLTISDYALAATPGTVTLKTGQSGSVGVTLTPLFNFQGNIALSCGPLPAHVSCSFQPATLTADGFGTPVQTTLTINTSEKAIGSLRLPGNHSPVMAGSSWFLGLSTGLILLFNRRRIAHSRALYFAVTAGLLLVTLLGPLACANGTWPDAAVGTADVTVNGTTTGANAVVRTAQVTLNIQ